jgi:RNA polymerase sigma factor (TIGR02999 family)
MTDPSDITSLLGACRTGEHGAWDALLDRVYNELKAVAHRAMSRESSSHLLQTTALVNEAYLRLVRESDQTLTSRQCFFRAAATAMRQILVDEARRRNALKRKSDAVRPLDRRPDSEGAAAQEIAFEDVEALNHALGRFEADPQHRDKAKIVELRFFAGLTIEQSAEVLGISIATVKRQWEFARAWLAREVARSSA